MMNAVSSTTTVVIITWRIFMAGTSLTSHVPDETYQAGEVAHHIAFGFGQTTWEWKSDVALRSPIYPLILAVPMMALRHPILSSAISASAMRWAIEVAPRVVQAVISAAGDLCFVSFVRRVVADGHVANIALLLHFVNAYLNFCASRTLIQSVECALTSVALQFYSRRRQIGYGYQYLVAVAVGFVLRPTFAIFWTPLICWHMSEVIMSSDWSRGQTRAEMNKHLSLCGCIIVAAIVIDSAWYGRFTVVPVNFVQANVFSGVASQYGINSIHWYVSSALPAMMKVASLALILSALKSHWRRDSPLTPYAVAIAFQIVVLSIVSAHKEFRFLLPQLPLLNVFAAYGCRTLGRLTHSRVAVVTLIALHVVVEVVTLIYLSLFHQRGTADVVRWLANDLSNVEVKSNLKQYVLFAMPCHATPLFSHMHLPAGRLTAALVLDCSPSIGSEDNGTSSDAFLADPGAWVAKYATDSRRLSMVSQIRGGGGQGEQNDDAMAIARPDFIVIFDYARRAAIAHAPEFMAGYAVCASFFNTHFAFDAIGEYVDVLCRN